MIEQQTEIATKDGLMSTFICHPERNAPHPVVILYMDAPGIREELRDMARRLATTGYYVLLPNLYYRFNIGELGAFVGQIDPAVRETYLALMNRLTIPMIMADTNALFAFTETQPAASPGPAGCVGYCMSGQYAVNAAAAYPERIKAAASFYGTKLVTDQPDSPHLAARKAHAELYFACAETDIYAPAAIVDALDKSLHDDAINAELERYPGTEHGFAFPGRPAFDKPAAERHWERIHALLARNLR